MLPLYGIVTQRGSMVEDVSGPGSTSTQQFASVLRQALADESVSQILIDIDSPGGSVYGVAELSILIPLRCRRASKIRVGRPTYFFGGSVTVLRGAMVTVT